LNHITKTNVLTKGQTGLIAVVFPDSVFKYLLSSTCAVLFVMTNCMPACQN